MPTIQTKASTFWTQDNFYRLLLCALLLRIILMPFFGHVDVLSEARRIYFWDESGIYFDNISRNATALFQLIFFKVFSIFIDNKDLLFFHEDMRNSTATPSEYYQFVSHENIFRALFVIKIPFLVADLVTAYAVYQFFDNKKAGYQAVTAWLFNPITIFAFYVFGRFESIPIMFCMLSLLMLKRDRLIWAALFIGLSINAREIFIFYGPLFMALILSPSYSGFSWFKRLLSCAVVAFFVAVSVQLISLTGDTIDAFGREVSSIAQEGRVDYLFRFIVGSYLMFPMVYFLTLLYTWNSESSRHIKAPLVYSLVLICFFSLSSHTAHYTSWLVVFPVLYLARDNKLLKPFIVFCVCWMVYNLAITDIGVFTLWLASPWSINFSGLPNFPMLYAGLGLTKYLDLLTFQRIARTFYVASILYMTVQMVLIYVRDMRNQDLRNNGDTH